MSDEAWRFSARWCALGALTAGLAVAAGAFGAHGLKEQIPADRLTIFEVGVRYQMYHALAVLIVSLLPDSRPRDAAGWAFLAGIVVFSGSLYVMALSGVRWWGAITPIGGVAFLIGWGLLVWAGVLDMRRG